MAIFGRMRSAGTMAALGAAHTWAAAQQLPVDVVVTYGPVEVASVPTLSEWGMVIMSVGLAVFAVRAMRKGSGSKTISAIALAAVGIWGAAQGYGIMGATIAAPPPGMTEPAGGTVQLQITEGNTIPVVNNTNPPVPLKIISVSPPEVLNAPGTSCTVGRVVAPADACNVSLPPPPNSCVTRQGSENSPVLGAAC